jgi:pyridoxal phosphate enzyme (YggS family)
MGLPADVSDPRAAEISANLEALRARIAAACRDADRKPDDVTLIVVTKTYPAADVLRLAALGVADVGENRDQEAAPKAALVDAEGTHVRWHFIGHLQRNKCRSVVGYAAMVHSLDSLHLVEALDRAAAISRSTELDVLVQVSLDGDTKRGGAVVGGDEPDTALDRVLGAVAAAAGLRLRGLMAVAPVEWDADRAFETLAEVRARALAFYPEATVLSAGMSGDLEQAIRHGATHVRVGSAVLGERPALR